MKQILEFVACLTLLLTGAFLVILVSNWFTPLPVLAVIWGGIRFPLSPRRVSLAGRKRSFVKCSICTEDIKAESVPHDDGPVHPSCKQFGDRRRSPYPNILRVHDLWYPYDPSRGAHSEPMK